MIVGLFNGIAVGIAGMIGGGIFLMNGTVVKNVGKYAPLSWLIGFIICITVTYSYLILSLEYPSKFGSILYPNKLLTNNLSKLISGLIIYLGYLVLISVYALSFGNYVSHYLNIGRLKNFVAILALIISMISVYMPKRIFENIINILVSFKVIIFSLIILLGIYLPRTSAPLKRNTNLQTISLFTSLIYGIKVFLSYEGFEMISNLSSKMENRDTFLPLSYILSVSIVCLIYMGLSYVTNKHLYGIINEKNQYSSIMTLTKMYNSHYITPLIVTLLCVISEISAINASLFTNNLIIERYIRDLKLPRWVMDILQSDIQLPFLKTKRKLYIWVGFLISMFLVFVPEILIVNFGSILFLLTFGIISYAAYLLVNKKEKEKKQIIILKRKIPNNISKIITALGMGFCLVGGGLLLTNIAKI